MTERMSSAEYRAKHDPWNKAARQEGNATDKAKSKKPRKKPVDREGPIQAACHGLMEKYAPDDCVYLSVPNEQVGGKGRGGKLNAMGRMAGAADYWVFYQGVMTFIEFKCPQDIHGPKTYLKPNQKDFRDMVTAMPRTRYAVCRNIEEFVLVLKPLGLLPNYRLTGKFSGFPFVMMDEYRLRELQA